MQKIDLAGRVMAKKHIIRTIGIPLKLDCCGYTHGLLVIPHQNRRVWRKSNSDGFICRRGVTPLMPGARIG